MNEFELLYEALIAMGPVAIAVGAVILVAVFVAKRAGLVATGNHARLANLLLGAIFAGLSENPQAESAMLAVLSSMLAALAFTLLEKIPDWIGKVK